MSGKIETIGDKVVFENESLQEKATFSLYAQGGKAYANLSLNHEGVESYAVIAVPMEMLQAVLTKGMEVVCLDYHNRVAFTEELRSDIKKLKKAK